MSDSEPDAGYYAALVAATFLMGSSFIAGKLLLASGVPALWLVGWRFLVAALATLPLVWLNRPRGPARPPTPPLNWRQAGTVALIGLTQTGAVMGLLFLSMREVSAAAAAILLFTNPIWVAVLGRLFLGEPLYPARIAGLALGIAGVALAIGVGAGAGSPAESDIAHVRGELTGLASAFCWAIATILNKRSALPLRTWTLSFWQMLVGSAALLALAYGLGEHPPRPFDTRQWGWFLWLAIPASTGSFGLWFLALRRGGATQSSGYLFLAPVFTVLLSLLVLHTPITATQALGGGLIGAAIWLVNREATPG